MSLQDIRDGLYFVLTTWGPYASREVSTCAFDVLESTSACAVVFMPGGDTSIEPLTFGASTTDQREWSISGAVYVKDTGDPKLFFKRVWQAHDDLVETIKKDRSLNGAALFGRVVPQEAGVADQRRQVLGHRDGAAAAGVHGQGRVPAGQVVGDDRNQAFPIPAPSPLAEIGARRVELLAPPLHVGRRERDVAIAGPAVANRVEVRPIDREAGEGQRAMRIFSRDLRGWAVAHWLYTLPRP